MLSGTSLANGNERNALNNLYKCDGLLGICNKVEKIYDGWYISGDNNYKAIKCVDESCSMVKELGNSCKIESGFIYNDSDCIYYIYIGTTKYNLKDITVNRNWSIFTVYCVQM